MYPITQYTQHSQEKEGPRGSQYQQKRKWSAKQEATATMSSHKAINN